MNKEIILAYKQTKEDLNEMEQKLKDERQKFEDSLSELKESIYCHKQSLIFLEENIEEEALKEFKETGKKKLLGGIGIQERKKLVYDEDKAFKWAKETGTCLQLDKKKFEKVGLEMTDFVKEEEKTIVTFPKVIKLED